MLENHALEMGTVDVEQVVVPKSAAGCVTLSRLCSLSVLRYCLFYNKDTEGCPELIPGKPWPLARSGCAVDGHPVVPLMESREIG